MVIASFITVSQTEKLFARRSQHARYTKGVKGWGQRLVSKVTPKFCVVNGQTEKLTVKILTTVAVVTTGHMGVTPPPTYMWLWDHCNTSSNIPPTFCCVRYYFLSAQSITRITVNYIPNPLNMIDHHGASLSKQHIADLLLFIAHSKIKFVTIYCKPNLMMHK